MNGNVYRYVISKPTPFSDAADTLTLALLGCESIRGESAVRLDARFVTDEMKRAIVIDASTDTGADLNRLFVGYLTREFGPDAFRVERIPRIPEAEPAAA